MKEKLPFWGQKAPSGAQMLVSGAFRRQKPAYTTLTARKPNEMLVSGAFRHQKPAFPKSTARELVKISEVIENIIEIEGKLSFLDLLYRDSYALTL